MPEQCLLDLRLPRSLDVIEAWAVREGASRLEAWVFEDRATRAAAELRLAQLGIEARLRSAYKPLLHAVLEDFGLEAVGQDGGTPEGQVLRVQLPQALAQRYRMEAYPLAGLLAEGALQFELSEPQAADTVLLQRGEQAPLTVFMPLRADHSATAWLRAWAGEALLRDGPLVGDDYQGVFDAVLAAVAAHDWGWNEPYFQRLMIEVEIGGIEAALPFGDEVISTREALHEDFYFGLLEFFQQRAGRGAGDRSLRPGQIVPIVLPAAAEVRETRVRMRLLEHPLLAESQAESQADGFDLAALATCAAPLSPALVAACMGSLAGERFGCLSTQGRAVSGLHRRGMRPAVVITAGQHANECSGVLGALRAVAELQHRADATYALVALENPDGAALHQQLCLQQPRHMHHAARFTALGDDLEWRTAPGQLGEKAARLEALQRSGARLHLSLHGYPAHEWTRPLSGYLPPGYASWAIPRGFFLIMRHHAGLDPWPYLQALTAGLALDERLLEFNARQYRLWEAHWGEMPMRIINGIGCMVAVDSRTDSAPFTLITEYPDETVYGEAFQLAHDTQTRMVLLACDLYWQGLLDPV
ncbi:hypothetical protein [Roseateles sp. PN1]|uniref:hypothetical protein n=1 Tax=Roseateles sp. PN1 TaxID=3137372 RepID=UPI0031393021